MNADVQRLHDIWCAGTNTRPNRMIWEAAYVDFLAKGFTPEDLQTVIDHIKHINKRDGAKFSLRQNLIFDWKYERFDSLLQEAPATKRNLRKPMTAKESAIADLRPVVDRETASTMTPLTARPVKEVFQQMLTQITNAGSPTN